MELQLQIAQEETVTTQVVANPLERYKRVSEQLRKLEKERSELKQAILALMGSETEFVLEGFKAEAILSKRTILDSEKIKDLFKDDLLSVQKTIEVLELKVL